MEELEKSIAPVGIYKNSIGGNNLHIFEIAGFCMQKLYHESVECFCDYTKTVVNIVYEILLPGLTSSEGSKSTGPSSPDIAKIIPSLKTPNISLGFKFTT